MIKASRCNSLPYGSKFFWYNIFMNFVIWHLVTKIFSTKIQYYWGCGYDVCECTNATASQQTAKNAWTVWDEISSCWQCLRLRKLNTFKKRAIVAYQNQTAWTVVQTTSFFHWNCQQPHWRDRQTDDCRTHRGQKIAEQRWVTRRQRGRGEPHELLSSST